MKSEPVFYLQIVRPDGVVAKLPGGGKLEVDLIEAVTERIMSEPLGLRTRAKISAAVSSGIEKAVRDLKLQSVKAL